MEPVELIRHLKSVFDLCDPNRLGYVTVDSFLSLSQQYLAPHRKDVENLLFLLDPGGKGYMTFEEFCRGVLRAMQGCATQGALDCDASSCLFVMGEGDMNNDYGMTAEDVADDTTYHHHRQSPESFGDTDSAIVVVVPANSESGSGSPEFGRKSFSVSDGEEKYESYGEAVNGGGDFELGPANNNNNNTITLSSKHRHGRCGQPKRSAWLRTSLRRSPSERRRLSASVLARSSSFNSCSRRSSSGESDDMHADLSLEDDVLDLSQRVQILQQQMTALANTQNTTDDKYSRVKQENAALTAKVHMLEEQLREVELRSESRIKEEQQRYKELVGRHERERSLDLETYNLKLQAAEKENAETREELFRLRSQTERLKQDKISLQQQLLETDYSLTTLQEEQRRLQEMGKRERDGLVQERAGNAKVLEELTKELHDLRKHVKMDSDHYQTKLNGHITMEPPSRLRDLEEQIRLLKEESRGLREANEELQAQLLNTSIAEGRNLLHNGGGTSLAAELEALSKDEIMEALREQKEVNVKLRAYIDGILLNILDCYPSILEVKRGREVP